MNTIMSGPQFMVVRPSLNNLHEFVAEENTCFFDICLPNYTADSLRRITYFRKVAPVAQEASETALSASLAGDGLTTLEFDATPPKLPVNFEVAEVPYIGEMK